MRGREGIEKLAKGGCGLRRLLGGTGGSAGRSKVMNLKHAPHYASSEHARKSLDL